MSYLLPCRPLQQQITVLVAQRVVRPLQIIAVRHNKTRRKIAGLYHMIAFRFQIFHEKTLPTPFSASARSSRKSSSPLRRLFTLHPNTLSCPVQCRYLPSPRYIPTCPLQNSRSPAFARSSTRHISSPSLQIAFIGYPSLISASRQIKTPFIKYTINTKQDVSLEVKKFHHKHHTRTVNPIRRLPAPPVLASKIPLRTLHNLPPKLLFRPPLRNPLLHKKPLFRFSPQKPIRIQSFS